MVVGIRGIGMMFFIGVNSSKEIKPENIIGKGKREKEAREM